MTLIRRRKAKTPAQKALDGARLAVRGLVAVRVARNAFKTYRFARRLPLLIGVGAVAVLVARKLRGGDAASEPVRYEPPPARPSEPAPAPAAASAPTPSPAPAPAAASAPTPSPASGPSPPDSAPSTPAPSTPATPAPAVSGTASGPETEPEPGAARSAPPELGADLPATEPELDVEAPNPGTPVRPDGADEPR